MSVNKNAAIVALALLWSAFGIGTAVAAGPAKNAEELVAQHLDSIGSAQVRAGLKSRVAQGPVQYTILVGGAGNLGGKAVLVSDGKKFQFMMKLPNNEYQGEKFVFDGEKDFIAFSTSRQTRSSFGNFMFAQDAAIREGLVGGTLSTAWPLLNLNERKAKLSLEGLKKIDGQDLYEVRYRPHKNSDLDIRLYFDPQTYRHVQTVYSYSVNESLTSGTPSSQPNLPAPGSVDSGLGAGMPGGSPETARARQNLTRYRLQEKFSDFKTVDGVTLPTHYDVQFTQELQNGKTTLSEYEMKSLELMNNVSVDARNFEVK